MGSALADKDDIQFHYDVGNDFYALFLDRAHRIYSCAVWEEGAETLEDAQTAKLARLARFAGVGPGHRVLDVGCGWGGTLRYCIDAAGAASGVGLTLSDAQADHIRDQGRDDIAVEVEAWQDYAPDKDSGFTPFDSIISIGAFEHFAPIRDRARGDHLKHYRAFFETCARLSADRAKLGLQTIVNTRPYPQTRESLRDVGYIMTKVFPDSALPTLNDIALSAANIYEIEELRTIGLDYKKTLEAWDANLRENRKAAVALNGEEAVEHYHRYFDICIRFFGDRVIDLCQASLRKIAADEAYKIVK